MNKWTAYRASMALISCLLVGCGGETNTNNSNDTNTGEAAMNTGQELTPVNFCGDCGQHKETEACCAKTGAACESCGFHKGAPLCCKLKQADVAGKTICGKCGEIAGNEKCCKEGAEVCSKCELNKGSAICCKLNKEE